MSRHVYSLSYSSEVLEKNVTLAYFFKNIIKVKQEMNFRTTFNTNVRTLVYSKDNLNLRMTSIVIFTHYSSEFVNSQYTATAKIFAYINK